MDAGCRTALLDREPPRRTRLTMYLAMMAAARTRLSRRHDRADHAGHDPRDASTPRWPDAYAEPDGRQPPTRFVGYIAQMDDETLIDYVEQMVRESDRRSSTPKPRASQQLGAMTGGASSPLRST